jgi:glycosyltransferase involved in cell wall biosynthesis
VVLKIAQIAPLSQSVPPKLYGGTERVVSYLAEELVRLGHDVTLFASGDSISSARLIACCERALWLDPTIQIGYPYYMIMLDRVRRMASEFDVLHFHIEHFHFPVFGSRAAKALTTLHGRQDLLDLHNLYRAFPEMPLVSISSSQREQIPHGNLVGTVLHGLPKLLYTPNYSPRGDYLAYLGRISSEKRVDRAIAIARAVGLPLKIAGMVYPKDEGYFTERIKPLISKPGVEFVGEIDDRTKMTFLGNALALIFPIDWPEPFGLVMIEAMACGTPVLAFCQGSVHEVVDSGITGYIVSDMDEATRVMSKLLLLDRVKVRRRFEERFSSERMARDYIHIYEKMQSG